MQMTCHIQPKRLFLPILPGYGIFKNNHALSVGHNFDELNLRRGVNLLWFVQVYCLGGWKIDMSTRQDIEV